MTNLLMMATFYGPVPIPPIYCRQIGITGSKIGTILVAIRLYMGVVYSVCGSAAATLAGDVLPPSKVGQGVNRFALAISLGMAAGPFVGIQVRNYLSSKASFLALFALAVIALTCVSFCRIRYPKVARKRFVLADAFYKPALPFMCNMIFIMIPFGAVIAYSSIFAQEKGLSAGFAVTAIAYVIGSIIYAACVDAYYGKLAMRKAK